MQAKYCGTGKQAPPGKQPAKGQPQAFNKQVQLAKAAALRNRKPTPASDYDGDE